MERGEDGDAQDTIVTKPRGSKLTVRLFAEFAVIVLGVLVALGFDSWVQNRDDLLRERQALETLRDDLELSAQDLRRVSEATLSQVERLAWLRSFPIDRSVPFPADSLGRMQSAANLTNAYAPILRTYDALIATGRLSLIRSQPIQLGLAGLEKDLDVYLDFRDQATNLWLLSQKPLWDRWLGSELGGASPLPPPDVIEAMGDREFRAMITSRETFLNIVAGFGTRLVAQMEEVVALIDAELERSER